MGKTNKNEYTATVGYVGTNKSKGTLGKFTNKNALKLCRTLIINLANKLVGEDNLNHFINCLAKNLLTNTNTRFDELFPHYKEKEDFDNIFCFN